MITNGYTGYYGQTIINNNNGYMYSFVCYNNDDYVFVLTPHGVLANQFPLNFNSYSFDDGCAGVISPIFGTDGYIWYLVENMGLSLICSTHVEAHFTHCSTLTNVSKYPSFSSLILSFFVFLLPIYFFLFLSFLYIFFYGNHDSCCHSHCTNGRGYFGI